MITPMKGNLPIPGRFWGADNGCFASPEKYSDSMYLSWLKKRKPHIESCLFATAPDVLCDPVATWQRSLPMFDKIRRLGYPTALVAQDGIEEMPLDWDAFDVLFVGGSTDWKLSVGACEVAREAKSRGKWIHLGRVNSLKRMRFAKANGYQSVDGTHLAFEPDAAAIRLTRWLEDVA